VPFAIERDALKIPEKVQLLPEDELREAVKNTGLKVVAATVGEDEHSVGLREILDIKHGGIEKYGVKYHYLGTSVPISKLIDAAIETGAQAILISTIISHNDIHRQQMKKLAELCQEKGIRDQVILIAGGTQVTPEMAAETGLDATFGRGTKGIHVVDAIVKHSGSAAFCRGAVDKDILTIEIGSTITKANAFRLLPEGTFGHIAQGFATTTVVEGDVGIGVEKALAE
jgi:D-ornithine 4,5-aminomutase subunit beta